MNSHIFVPGQKISIRNADGPEVDMSSLKWPKRIPVHGPLYTSSLIVENPEDKHPPIVIKSSEGETDNTIRSPEFDLRTFGSDIPPSSSSAFTTACPIEDFGDIPYPEGIQGPKAELNVNAANGKFIYDRKFLLQFMPICKEKPENLSPPDAIDLEPTKSRKPIRNRGSSRKALPTSHQASIGLDFTGGSTSKGDASPFTGTDNFTTSSEEHFEIAADARSASAHSGEPGLSPGGHPSPNQGGFSKDRQRTRSARRTTPSKTPPLHSVVPLKQSAQRWIATNTILHHPVDTDSLEVVDRKVRALLNKLTMERFDSISDQIIEWANKSEKEKDGRSLLSVIRLVFESAIDQAIFSEMYARLCLKMMERISTKIRDDEILNSKGKPFAGGRLFLKHLINRCQEDFERDWVAKETAAVKTREDQANPRVDKESSGEADLFSDDYYAAAKVKRRGLGLIRLMGELFKMQMITERVIHNCIRKFLSNVENPEEVEIERLCMLLITVGQAIDRPKVRAHMDVYFSRMKGLTKNKTVNSRMIFMLLDVIELRDSKWIPRKQVEVPMTIAQVHEAATKEWEALHGQTAVSRLGSRRKTGCVDGSLVGPDGRSVAGSGPTRPPPKASDLSNFGKISKPAPMTFGPSGIFAGKKESKGREVSVSRTASSSNMFSMPSDADAVTEATQMESSWLPVRKPNVDLTQSGGVPDQQPQRRKLNRLMRSKAVEETKAVVGGPSMTGEEAKRQINEDVKEPSSVRSLDDVDAYLASLPSWV